MIKEKALFLIFGIIQSLSLGFIIYFILNSLGTIGLDTQITLSCIFPLFLLMIEYMTYTKNDN